MVPPAKKTKTSHSGKVAVPAAPPVQPSGDDLEDNLALDDQFLGSDNDDGAADFDGEDGTEGVDYLSLDEDAALPAKQGAVKPDAGGKKKRGAEEAADGERPQKAKKDKTKSKKKAKLEELGLNGGAHEDQAKDDTALLPVEVLADRIAEKQKRALPNLSGLELDEQRISQSMIMDTSSVSTRDSLLDFMKAALPTACTTLGKMPKATGSPRIIVCAGAALRVADLCRDVKSFKTKTKDGVIDVAKLFAKHFKLAEHAEYMKKTHVGVAVGTPNRIEKLLNETDSLHLTHLSHLILDVSHLDAKKRSLLDLPDARGDLFKLLGCKPIMERLREGKMKLVVF
ncbi:hypothetical protein JCM21900_006917 [Sporobolomyces salmonicolor]